MFPSQSFHSPGHFTSKMASSSEVDLFYAFTGRPDDFNRRLKSTNYHTSNIETRSQNKQVLFDKTILFITLVLILNKTKNTAILWEPRKAKRHLADRGDEWEIIFESM